MKEGGKQTKFFKKFFLRFQEKKRKSDIKNRRSASSASNTGENGNSFQKKFILDYISLNVLS